MIGTAETECFDGHCHPWSKGNCAICPIRPMKVYVGNDGSKTSVERMVKMGYGIMMTNRYYNPERFPYYAIDNGAFGCWKSGRPWDGDSFIELVERFAKENHKPDFIVTPDKVAEGLTSLFFSLSWIEKLLSAWEDGTYFLAVQDGMSSSDVKKVIDKFGGLFVGGTLKWKYRTSPAWIELAHSVRKPCHIGRVGTWPKIVWAHRIGADSIDSMSWGKNASYHHLADARIQRILTDDKEGN